MKKIILFGIFLMLFCLSGCSSQRETIYVDSSQISIEEKDIQLYIKKEMEMAPYEPAQGIYLGAYFQDGTIQEFEALVGQKQGFEIFQYTTKGSITQQDLLKCIANQNTPYIKLLLDEDLDLTRLYTMIGDLNNRYKTPIFIELFPVTSKVEDPIAYKEHYERAYKLIKKYLDESVIVWSIDLQKAYEMPLYYPGGHMVDWVGMNCYWPKYQNGMIYEIEPLEAIDFLYKNVQEEKPMFLSGVAISHFSTVDHTYTVSDAKNKLALFYDEVPMRYPRIKGIFYIDVDMKSIAQGGADDYRVSTQQILREYLGKQFEKSSFLKQVYPQEQEKIEQYQMYQLSAKIWDEQVYVNTKDIDVILRGMNLKSLTRIEEQQNQYYNLKELMETVACYYTE